MRRLWRLIKSLTRLRWRILPPRHKPVLLYFVTGADVIAPYFSQDEFQVLDLREHEVNLWVAVRCLFDRNLSAQNYALIYIEIVKPRLVITFIDNFPAFFQVKNRFPKITTVLIQNGVRVDPHDLFETNSAASGLPKNFVDKMFVFGSAIGSTYAKYTDGKIVSIGSFKNNLVPITKSKKRTVAYISTYRSGIARTTVIPDSVPGFPIQYGQIIDRREQTITFLANFCKNNNLSLVIIGKDEDFEGEKAYYDKLLKDFSWTIAQRQTTTINYAVVDESEIVVFTSSTLGYESLARGKKTAALLIDAEIIDSPSIKFGWPVSLSDDGKFWTNRLDENRFEEILNYLLTASNDDWEKVRAETMREIIDFDPGNSQFVEMVQSLRADW
jgi:surface carbohydrate biosynthesis protein